MFFDMLLRDIIGVPQFESFWLVDRNPLSGHNKRRRIYNPNKPMREVHALLIDFVRKFKIEMPNATGALPEASPLRNVLRHKHYGRRNETKVPFRRYFYLIDISSAYQSVDARKLAAVIHHYNSRLPSDEHDVLGFLKKYCISAEEGGLIVGAPASPDLFNIYCEEFLDQFLRPLCEKYGLVYTRYLDDLTFSSNRPIGTKKRKAIRTLVEKVGFKMSHRKAQVIDLRKGPVTVNGVGITIDGRTFLPRNAIRELRGLLHRALTGNPVNESQVHGKMGVFKALTNLQNLNQTERKILEQYEQFRRQIASTSR